MNDEPSGPNRFSGASPLFSFFFGGGGQPNSFSLFYGALKEGVQFSLSFPWQPQENAYQLQEGELCQAGVWEALEEECDQGLGLMQAKGRKIHVKGRGGRWVGA